MNKILSAELNAIDEPISPKDFVSSVEINILINPAINTK